MSKHGVFPRSNLGRHTAHRMSMFKTMVTQLLDHEGIKTTEVKMKRVKPLVDKVTKRRKKKKKKKKNFTSFLSDDRSCEERNSSSSPSGDCFS